jgi:hypothetical protein
MPRGIAFQLVEALGVLNRRDVADDVRGSTRMPAPRCAGSASASAPTISSCRRS